MNEAIEMLHTPRIHPLRSRRTIVWWINEGNLSLFSNFIE
jgi:hypothetical protein